MAKRAIMAVLALDMAVGGGTAARASCALPTPTPNAYGWYVVEGDPFDFTARNPALPDLGVPLLTDAPVIPRVLDFVVLPRYGGRIALLQYFSGDPGTSELVTLIRNAVVDLQTGETLGMPVYSADCVSMDWRWYDERIEVHEHNGVEIVALPPMH
ncbi:hypothetical protein JI664_04510 [Rhodobacter sp. NTK016B]|uniref:hypothetical protein n=1 Tax=Rhodobacter sp. NTK016B TaxID=2759676 RepID=UPI001A909172|nr:hypothetical protein [Rhodobacter sp. NTK016B]MBN8291219.1 hypothetical protein [Rhodobacter sp. NTK016B]